MAIVTVGGSGVYVSSPVLEDQTIQAPVPSPITATVEVVENPALPVAYAAVDGVGYVGGGLNMEANAASVFLSDGEQGAYVGGYIDNSSGQPTPVLIVDAGGQREVIPVAPPVDGPQIGDPANPFIYQEVDGVGYVGASLNPMAGGASVQLGNDDQRAYVGGYADRSGEPPYPVIVTEAGGEREVVAADPSSVIPPTYIEQEPFPVFYQVIPGVGDVGGSINPGSSQTLYVGAGDERIYEGSYIDPANRSGHIVVSTPAETVIVGIDGQNSNIRLSGATGDQTIPGGGSGFPPSLPGELPLPTVPGAAFSQGSGADTVVAAGEAALGAVTTLGQIVGAGLGDATLAGASNGLSLAELAPPSVLGAIANPFYSPEPFAFAADTTSGAQGISSFVSATEFTPAIGAGDLAGAHTADGAVTGSVVSLDDGLTTIELKGINSKLGL